MVSSDKVKILLEMNLRADGLLSKLYALYTISCETGSDSKLKAYIKVISCVLCIVVLVSLKTSAHQMPYISVTQYVSLAHAKYSTILRLLKC